MRLRPFHLLHSAIVLVVLVLVGFGSAFLADAISANRTYDRLAAHHVVVKANVVYCTGRPAGRLFGRSGGYVCLVSYTYAGQTFQASIPGADPKIFYVDPADPAYRMSEASFRNGPRETTGDVVIASLLFCGAVAITTVHQVHLYRRRRDRGEAVHRRGPRSRSG